MIQDKYIKEFYNEICKNKEGNYKIIVEPNVELNEEWVEHEQLNWIIEDRIKDKVEELYKNENITLENKIIQLYEYICLKYVYDANVLYFFRVDNSDPDNIKYIAVDWYGRIIGKDWIEKRKNHNRRICYEFSRLFAKAINKLIDNKRELEAFMVGDVENTHYVVGLTGKDYSAILDQDNFLSIKDLTRVKLGLTIKGIQIFRDDADLLKKEVDKYNKNKLEEPKEITEQRKNLNENNMIDFFNLAIELLNKHNIDSQGFFEYIRTLIEEQGITIEKIWKEDTKNVERRYERCLYFEYKQKMYLLDSIEKNLNQIEKNNLDSSLFVVNPQENEYKYYGG